MASKCCYTLLIASHWESMARPLLHLAFSSKRGHQGSLDLFNAGLGTHFCLIGWHGEFYDQSCLVKVLEHFCSCSLLANACLKSWLLIRHHLLSWVDFSGSGTSRARLFHRCRWHFHLLKYRWLESQGFGDQDSDSKADFDSFCCWKDVYRWALPHTFVTLLQTTCAWVALRPIFDRL